MKSIYANGLVANIDVSDMYEANKNLSPKKRRKYDQVKWRNKNANLIGDWRNIFEMTYRL